MNMTVNRAETVTITLSLSEAQSLYWAITPDSINEEKHLEGYQEEMRGTAMNLEAELGATLADACGVWPDDLTKPEPSNVIPVDFGTDGLYSPSEVDKALQVINAALASVGGPDAA